MAQQNAFNQALIRIGLNIDMTERMIDEGFDTLETLPNLEESDIDNMMKNVHETRRALGANAQGNVTFPFLPTKSLKAMSFWAAELKRTGRPLNNPGLFAGPVIQTAVAQYSLELLRSAQVDPALYLLPYADHDSRLVNTTELLGPWFEIENHCVYDKFKALVLKGPGWSFVKAFDRTRNGREAVLALKCQCEGTSAIQSRKAAAYAKIASARYSGHKKTFTFDNYVEMHQNAHNTLSELDEPVPETKKVTDFLAEITDSRLGNAKDLILGDPNKLQNFEACQQYLKTLVYNKTTQEKHERQISGDQLQQGQGKGKGGDGKSKNTNGKRSSDGIDDSKVVAKQYTRAEWFKLTPEQRKKKRS